MRLLLAMPGNSALGVALSDRLDVGYAEVQTRRFPDDEIYVRLPVDVAARDVDILCTLARPDTQFLSLAFAAQTARQLGANSVRLVAPYLAYLRQDKQFHPGEAVSARGFAQLVSTTFDAVTTIDPHLHRIGSLSEIYSIPTHAVSAAALLGRWVRENAPNSIIIGPDYESEQWVRSVAIAADAPCIVLEKTRHGDRSVTVAAPNVSAWRGRTAILVDDIASTGQTIISTAGVLAAAGFSKPICLVVHALCGPEPTAAIEAATSAFISTDTVLHPTNRICVADLLAEAMRRQVVALHQ